MENKKLKCKKLKYGNKNNPTILLGLVVSDDVNFIIFRTGRREYTISKHLILEIEETSTDFLQEGEQK